MLAILPNPTHTAIVEIDKPVLAGRQVLIKVHAAGVNRADLLQRKGLYPPPEGESEVLGLEAAGEVVELGFGCKKAQLGQKVFALLAGGGYAEYVAIDEDLLMPIPSTLSYAQAAAIAEVFLTAYQSLAWLAHLKAGETVLVHGGAGGIGTACIQLARQIGACTIVTVSSPTKASHCLALGATHAIVYTQTNFVDAITRITQEQGVNVIVDSIGGSYFSSNLNALSLDGRLVMLALQGGSRVTDCSLGPIISKRLNIVGSTLRNRNLDYKARLTQEFTQNFLRLFASGVLQPVIHQVMSWRDASNAHNLLADNQTIGKIVLTID